MALVVFLRGVNVGGHKTFRPTRLVGQLRHLGAVNVGAAGTFLFRRPIRPAQLRTEIARRLPFEAEIMICQGRDIRRLVSRDPFAAEPARPEVVRFVSVLARLPRSAPALPMQFPSEGPWVLKVLAREGKFVLGEYRRHMKAIGYLGKLDRLFGAPVTTRNWSTITAVDSLLEQSARGERPDAT